MTDQEYFGQRQEDLATGCLMCLVLGVLVIAMLIFCVLREGKARSDIAALEEETVAVDTVRVPEQLSDWQVLLLAVAMTESEFYPTARASNDDWGILQITPVYVAEVNRVTGANYAHEDAWLSERSLEMFTALQDHHNPEHDIDKAIRLHNSNPWYAKRVKQNMEFVRRYEAFRTVLENNQ